MRHLVLIAVLLASPLAFAKGKDIDKVNGSIQTEAGTEYGELETVNGSINLQKGSSAESISTVNGSIRVGDDAVLGSAETVNGGITIGTGVEVGGAIETVNGAIRVERDSRIHGRVETVNGSIELDAAELDKDIETVNGSITVGANAIVHGGIQVRKPRGSGWNMGWNQQRKPRIVIGPNATVKGALVFEHEVELFVHDTAKVGAITGATAVKFSGNEP